MVTKRPRDSAQAMDFDLFWGDTTPGSNHPGDNSSVLCVELEKSQLLSSQMWRYYPLHIEVVVLACLANWFRPSACNVGAFCGHESSLPKQGTCFALSKIDRLYQYGIGP